MTDGRNIHARILVALGAAFSLLAATIWFAGAAGAGDPAFDFVVTTAADPLMSYDLDDDQCDDGPDGACTLREAVLEGVGNAGGANITFDPSIDGTSIDLQGDIPLAGDGPITIAGNGVANTIIGSVPYTPVAGFYGVEQQQDRHFDVVDTDLSISGVTLRDGSDTVGGSIRMFDTATVSVDAVHFIGNQADSAGGAIFAGAQFNTLEVSDTTFSDNSAGLQGGAIAVGVDTAEIVNSTFTGNAAPEGAALWVSRNGEATVDFSTFSGNVTTPSEGAPVQPFRALPAGSALPAGGTISHADTVEPGDDLSVSNSIIEGTTGESTAECSGGTITSGGGNVVDDSSCNFTAAEDHQDTAANVGALGDNGGPTFTMALAAESPAVDAIASCDLTADQRGEPRPEDGDDDGTAACDSGAYELAVPAPAPTNSGTPVPDDDEVDDTVAEAPAATPTRASPTFTG